MSTFDLSKEEAAIIFHKDAISLILPDFEELGDDDTNAPSNVMLAVTICTLLNNDNDDKFKKLISEKLDEFAEKVKEMESE